MRLTKSRAALIAIRHFWLRATGAFFTINRCALIDYPGAAASDSVAAATGRQNDQSTTGYSNATPSGSCSANQALAGILAGEDLRLNNIAYRHGRRRPSKAVYVPETIS
jgi:hypothetical protein